MSSKCRTSSRREPGLLFALLALAVTVSGCGEPQVEKAKAVAPDDTAGAHDVGTSGDGAGGDVASGDSASGDDASSDVASGDVASGDTVSDGGAEDATDALDGAATDAASDATSTSDGGPTGTPCTSAAGCGASEPHCLLPQGVCGECKYPMHCKGEHARCAAGTCIAPKACVSDKDCAGDLGVCDPAVKHCADCVNHDDCSAGNVCKAGQCLPTPKDCKSSKACAALGQVCTAANICQDCGSHSDCGKGTICAKGLCLPALCMPGASECVGPVTKKVCDGDGKAWAEEKCGQGQACAAGACVKQLCVPGALKCESDKPATCNENGLAWVAGAACKAPLMCIDGKCAKKKLCSKGDTQCDAAGKLKTCADDGTSWATSACPSETICKAGECQKKLCNKGDTACDGGGKLKTCAGDGLSWVTSACPSKNSCKSGKCVAQTCAPDATSCQGDKLMVCDKLGLGTTLSQDCTKSKTVCTIDAKGATCAAPTCKAGEQACKGAQIATCKADGKGWDKKDCGDIDNNKCTTETCDASQKKCVSSAPKACDDGNACTTGNCAKATGACSQAPKSGTCNDANACTSGDLCAAGKCVPGPTVVATKVGKSGGGYVDGAWATARVNGPWGMAAGNDGSIVFADQGNRRIRRLQLDGTLTTVAGNGNYGFADGTASTAMFRNPRDVTVDKAGWIYVADYDNHRLRAVSPAGVVTTVAGNGSANDVDGKALAASLYRPDSLAVNSKGELWFGESYRHKIRMLNAAGDVVTMAGTGSAGFADGAAAAAKFYYPEDIALGPKGLLWIVDRGNRRIRAYDPAKKTVVTKMGTGSSGATDGPALSSTFSTPRALTFDKSGRLWLYDYGNYLVRRLNTDGKVVTIAGSKGKPGSTDGNLSTARFGDVRGMVVDASGSLWTASTNYSRLRAIQISTKACDDDNGCTTDACDPKSGNCVYKPANTGAKCDDGDACTANDTCSSQGTCTGSAKNCSDGNACTVDTCDPYKATCTATFAALPCSDGDLCTPADICVNGTCKNDLGSVDTIVGSGDAAPLFGKSAATGLNRPTGLARDSKGNLYIADRYTYRILKIAAKGGSSVFAGDGTSGFKDGPAATARFYQPHGLAVDAGGNVIVADTYNQRIRRISASGVVTTIGGTGGIGFVDGKVGVSQFNYPMGVSIDSKGNVWVADRDNHAIRRISAAGVTTTIAGDGKPGFYDGTGKYTRLSYPHDVIALANGGALVADRNNNRIRAIDAKGAISTWAGSGQSGTTEGGKLGAAISQPVGLARAADGSVWVTSSSYADVRVINARGEVHRVTRGGGGLLDGPATLARFNNPRGVVAISGAEAWVADAYNNRIRRVKAAVVTCGEGTPCAPESCDSKTGTCAVKAVAPGGACKPGLCKIDGSCIDGKCTGGKTDTCDDKNSCTLDTCHPVTGACRHILNAAAPGCCKPVVWADGLESGTDSFVTEPTIYAAKWLRWTPTKAGIATEGKSLLKMGAPGDAPLPKFSSYAYSYTNGPYFTVPSGVETTLTFKYNFDLKPTSAHRLYVYLQRESGQTSYIGNYYGSKTGWQTFSASMAGYAGQKLRVRLRGRIYGAYGIGNGILVDDIKLTSPCKPKTCTSSSHCSTTLSCNKGACTDGKCVYTNTCCQSDLECDDSKPCTIDYCNSSSGCQHSQQGACCNSPNDPPQKLCDDQNPCTADVCPTYGGPCEHNIIAGCCLVHADCDDGKSCTIDSCTAKNTCKHTNTCCKTDKECDDGDNICSTDKCVNGTCAWKYTDLPGCCEPLIGPWDFNASTQLKDWKIYTCLSKTYYYRPTACKLVTPTSPWKGWQLWTDAPIHKSAKGALYYGDIAAKNFNFGTVAQAIVSPKMNVYAGHAKLKFSVYWDTGTGTYYDKLIAFIWVDGVRISPTSSAPAAGGAWYKGQTGYTQAKVWKEVSIDVSAYAGKQIQVEFFFNSGSASNNTGAGVFIDDLRLENGCK